MGRKSVQKYVAGNWKMFSTQISVDEFVGQLSAQWQPNPDVVTVIFPPAPYLAQLRQGLQGVGVAVAIGGQALYPADEGAFTGEISAGMLRDLGASWFLAGHSERRTLFAESDEFVASQVLAGLAAQLKPVLCVGETLAERESGEAQAVVARQLSAVLRALAAAGQPLRGAVAYEPVWAIGTGKTASPQQAQEMHEFIRAQLRAADADLAQLPLWYGGSVKPENAAELFGQPDIDGALVGGASLTASSFLQIIEQARG